MSIGKIVLLVVVVAGLVLFFYKRNENARAAVASNAAAAAKFLAENRDREDVMTTSSGLQYQVLQKGTGARLPSASDTVKVHYQGSLLDGSVFDSSIQRGEPIEFGLNQVIKGWTEGLQLMTIGDRFRLFIPADLGYGKRGAGSIPPGALLIFDVELLAINGQS